MDFYNIGAMKVFSQLGQLIEADILAAEAARQQKQEDALDEVKLSDLPIDIMQKIGSYLLQDPNKTVHKIFKNRPDDDLQVLLFGEVKDLTCINIHDSDNEIGYPINYKLLDYVNYILKIKGVKLTLEKMRVNFYIEAKHFQKSYFTYRKVKIIFYNKDNKQIATIMNDYYCLEGSCNYILSYRHDNKWNDQNIKKKDITDEYETIHEELCNKYF